MESFFQWQTPAPAVAGPPPPNYTNSFCHAKLERELTAQELGNLIAYQRSRIDTLERELASQQEQLTSILSPVVSAMNSFARQNKEMAALSRLLEQSLHNDKTLTPHSASGVGSFTEWEFKPPCNVEMTVTPKKTFSMTFKK
jgi:uncharacterized coiled-coil protein SlyX